MHIPDGEEGEKMLAKFHKQTRKDSRKRWKCKRCFTFSLKKKNLRHEKKCLRKDNSRLKLETRISRACYLGHPSVFGIGKQEALFRCLSCGYEWIAVDGEVCAACKAIHRTHGPNPIYAKKKVQIV